ncbi:MAG: hypothetical protein KFF73_00355 [Cyclobacteriaceae bacterium]|nr:hypothetical protein [Cyclobacteriaceae bacterium]
MNNRTSPNAISVSCSGHIRHQCLAQLTLMNLTDGTSDSMVPQRPLQETAEGGNKETLREDLWRKGNKLSGWF